MACSAVFSPAFGDLFWVNNFLGETGWSLLSFLLLVLPLAVDTFANLTVLALFGLWVKPITLAGDLWIALPYLRAILGGEVRSWSWGVTSLRPDLAMFSLSFTTALNTWPEESPSFGVLATELS